MSGTSSVSPTILVPGAPVAANSSIDTTGLILSTTAHGQAFGNNPSSQGYGGLVQLVGSNTGTIAAAMDYVLDGGGWAPVSNFDGGADWSGQGPQVTSGTHTIQVRDHTDTGTVSNVETFTVGVGLFVWDGVTLH